jgi:hypothetical protein
MVNNLTLFSLLHFTPLNEYENEIFSCDKLIINHFISQLDNDIFYLGGQVKMKHDDIINLDSIQQVREINRKRDIEYGGACNGFEFASIRNSIIELQFIENMIMKYNKIMEIREKEKLSESNSNYDI